MQAAGLASGHPCKPLRPFGANGQRFGLHARIAFIARRQGSTARFIQFQRRYQLNTILRNELQAAIGQLQSHRIFSMIGTRHELRQFMQWHVYAVWDFMSLVKRLQRDLTCTSTPWVPPRYPAAARLINEIVLGEETDLSPGGGHDSHFNLYLQAMREVGADTSGIDSFVSMVGAGAVPAWALDQVAVDPAVTNFVLSTLETATYASTVEVLGSFFYGREDLVPRMFRRLMEASAIDGSKTPTLIYYLERHIDLDEGEHGPAAERIIAMAVDGDAQKEEQMLRAAIEAVHARRRLWDALALQLGETVAMA